MPNGSSEPGGVAPQAACAKCVAISGTAVGPRFGTPSLTSER